MTPNADRPFPLWAKLLAWYAIAVALFHAAGALGAPIVVDLPQYRHYPMMRHAAMTLVALATAAYFRWRPLWALPIMLLLVVQQTYGHGSRLIRWWQERHVIEPISLIEITAVCFALVMVMREIVASRR